MANPSQYTVPFSIQIPHWLPPSFAFSNRWGDIFCAISYVLRAQFLALEKDDWAQAEEGISKFRGELVVSIVNKSTVQVLPNPVSQVIQKAVGFNNTNCKVSVLCERQHYFIGEKIRVQVQVDNSECDVSQKHIKVRLQVVFSCQVTGVFKELNEEGFKRFISETKTSGPAKGQSQTSTLELQIPAISEMTFTPWNWAIR